MRRERDRSSIGKLLRNATGYNIAKDGAVALATALHHYAESERNRSPSVFSVTEGPPFDPFEFAQLLNITVCESKINTDGLLITRGQYSRLSSICVDSESYVLVPSRGRIRDTDPVIVLQRLEPDEFLVKRQRRLFTLSHEIGHIVLRKCITAWGPSAEFSCDDPVEERLCNVFGAELLMPTQKLVLCLAERGISADTLLDLRTQYGVSLKALLSKVSDTFRGSVLVGLHHVDERELVRTEFEYPVLRHGLIPNHIVRDWILRATETEQQVEQDLIIEGCRYRWRMAFKRLPGSRRVLILLYPPLEFVARYFYTKVVHLDSSGWRAERLGNYVRNWLSEQT